jgi:hypothetical protein
LIVYAESSAVLSWLLGEVAGERVRQALARADHFVFSDPTLIESDACSGQALARADHFVSSDLTLIESDACFTRAAREGHFDIADAMSRRARLARAVAGWTMHRIGSGIVQRARQRAEGIDVRRSLPGMKGAHGRAASNSRFLEDDMRDRLMSWLVVPCLALLAPLAASGQEASSPRSGFGLALGMGGGSAGVTCEGCDVDVDERTNGISGYFRIGGYASDRLFVGIEGTGWMNNEEGIERRIAGASLVFVGYPSATAGFFLRAGFGGTRAVIEDDFASITGNGLLWSAGTGFDINLGNGAAITPYVNYLAALETTAHVNDIATDIILNPNILQVGLAVTIQ